MDTMIRASEIAAFLGSELFGADILLKGPTPISELKENSVAFAKFEAMLCSTDFPCLVLVPNEIKKRSWGEMRIIPVGNPRLAFAKVIEHYWTEKKDSGISSTAVIGKNVSLGDDVVIGHYCVIGNNVKIGKRTVLNSHIVISDNTVIGANCYIKSGTIIGEDGFGFERDENMIPVRFPHVGRVVIGDGVEIGSKCTIPRGAIADTTIGDNVKIDDQVHFAHNVIAGENTIITACAELSGGVCIGKNCWIAPNVSIMQKKHIGDNSLIGLGAVVLKDVENDSIMVGNPAKLLKKCTE